MLTGNKNVDFKILNELDDKDLVNICQTNKLASDLCNDQTFWLNRIRIKFPDIPLHSLHEGKKDRLWSQYYIKDLRRITPLNAQRKLSYGSRTNRLDHVIISLGKGADINYNHNEAIQWASSTGNLEMVKYLHEKGALLDYYSLRRAKHYDVVEYLLSFGVTDN